MLAPLGALSTALVAIRFLSRIRLRVKYRAAKNQSRWEARNYPRDSDVVNTARLYGVKLPYNLLSNSNQWGESSGQHWGYSEGGDIRDPAFIEKDMARMYGVRSSRIKRKYRVAGYESSPSIGDVLYNEPIPRRSRFASTREYNLDDVRYRNALNIVRKFVRRRFEGN